jgi:hypothetical protein
MSSRSVEAMLYRDLEKIHRVIGYYEGQEIKPLEIHEEFIQKSLDIHLRNPETYIRRVQYELNMTEVSCANTVVFNAENPETSLVYTLFSEGIKSVIFVRDLSSTEMKDWALLVRRTLEEFDRGGRQDLATILWRSPFRNLRTRIYNSLFDLVESQQSAAVSEAEKLEGSWHYRDQEWDLPEADSVVRDSFEDSKVDGDVVDRLKAQMQKLEVSETMSNAFKLSHNEIKVLAEELSSYDQNQVDYNLLSMSLGLLKSSEETDEEASRHAQHSVLNITNGILNRFQPSLINLLLDQIEDLKDSKLEGLVKNIQDLIGESLIKPSNEKKLMDSLRDPERSQITKRLLPMLRIEQFPSVVDFYLMESDKDGLVDFIQILIERKLNLEKIFFSWGEERMTAVLPLLRRLDWPHKYSLLERAVKSPSLAVRKQASHYLPNIKMAPEAAVQIYRQLPDEVREVWQRAFLEQNISEHWKPFIIKFFQTRDWMRSESSIMGNRLMMGWVEVALKYLGPVAIQMLSAWVKERKFFLWPRWPAAREAILSAMLNSRDQKLRGQMRNLIQDEESLRFQPAELRQRLGAFRP